MVKSMKDTHSISAGIVLYNPNIKELKKIVFKLCNNLSKVYLINNNSNNTEAINKNFNNSNIIIINNKENYGIAKGLNQILDLSLQNNDEFVLTLDQDSCLEVTDIEKMLEYSTNDCSLIVPNINDINKPKIKKYNSEFDYIKRAITSGTLMRVSDIKENGYFDEKMFIDYVDFDYCKRVISNNKKILRVNNINLNHAVGKRIKRKFLFFTVYPTNHNAQRIYYYSRNIRYYLKKHKKNLSLKEKLIEKKYLYWKLVSIILYEKDKKNKIKAFYKGKKDYKKMK